MNRLHKADLLAAMDAQIIRLECEIEATESAMKMLVDQSDLMCRIGILIGTSDKMRIRRRDIENQ